jgi:hypothetical protein
MTCDDVIIFLGLDSKTLEDIIPALVFVSIEISHQLLDSAYLAKVDDKIEFLAEPQFNERKKIMTVITPSGSAAVDC